MSNYKAAIHITKSKLKLTDSDYRALLMRVAGVSSSKDLDESGSKAVLREFYHLEAEQRSYRDQTPKSPMCAKIWALWFELQNYFAPEKRTIAYFVGIVRQASGCSNLNCTEFDALLTPKELYKTIEALKLRLDQESRDAVPF